MEGGREPTPFIGRSWERERLVADLLEGRVLLTITGLSGVGKSRLARAAAAEVAQRLDGVFFCDLGGCGSSADLERAIAEGVGLGHWSPGKLDASLAEKGRILLILDGAERAAEELAALIAPWLTSCPQLQMIVTSIVPLEMEGEIWHQLGPLRVEDAISLFVDRAHAAGRTITSTDGPVVEKLVERLGYIPFSIELAAARALVLPPADLLARLDRPELVLSQRAGKRVRSSINDALSLTWDILSPEDRRALAQATIFAGGFTLDAAIEVLGDPEEPGAILDRLDSLRGKSLLSIQEGEPSRFFLLRGIHDFASRKLDEAGDRAELTHRHVRYYLEKGEGDVERLETANFLEALRSLRAERDNLAHALRRTLQSDPSVAARVGLILGTINFVEGKLRLGSSEAELTLEAAKASGSPLMIARATFDLVRATDQKRSAAETIANLDEVLRMAREVGDRSLEADVLTALAYTYSRIGEGLKSIAYLDEAVEAARSCGDHSVEAGALVAQGADLINFFRDASAAEERLEGARTILRTHRLEQVRGHFVPSMHGAIRTLQGRFREARRALETALENSIEVENPLRTARDHLNLAWLESLSGRVEDAARHAQTALGLFRRYGFVHGEGVGYHFLGLIQAHQGEWELAEATLTKAVGVLADEEERLWHARSLALLAVAEANSGRFADASQSLEESRSFFAEEELIGDLRICELLEGSIDVARARALREEDPAKARRLVESARRRFEAETSDEVKVPLRDAVDLLQNALDAFEQLDSGRGEGGGGLVVAHEGEWFELGEERVDLRRRSSIRRILDYLAQRRLEAPGAGADPRELFKIGWPKTKVGIETELKRVYIAIWTLRNLGLADVLLNQEDGYLLDPEVPLSRSSS